MAANTQAIYPAAPVDWRLSLATANPGRTNQANNVQTLATGGNNGARIDRVHVKPLGTVHAQVVRLWLAGSGTCTLLHEIQIPAATATGLAPTKEYEWSRSDGEPVALLGANEALSVTAEIADPVEIVAFGGTY